MLRVMTKDGKSYVKLEQNAWTTAGAFRINGMEAVRGSGDHTWAVVTGEIQTIERRDRKPSVIVGYQRNEGSPSHLPETLPADAFEYDYEDGGYKSHLGYDRKFYEATYQDGEDYWTPMEFEVIDRNTEPVDMPNWVTVNWPANVERCRETQHKYPCYITRESLFALVASAVEKKITESRGALEWNDFRNIGTFTVKRWVEIPVKARKPERVEYYPSINSRKPKTKTIVREGESRDLFTYNGFYKDGRKNEIKAPSIQAANYAELAEAVSEHVEAIAALCDTTRYCICEKCNGLGMTVTSPAAS